MISRKLKLSLGALLAVTVSSGLVLAAIKIFSAPEADLWDRWAKHNENSEVVVSHDAWDQLLQEFVIKTDDGVALVAYDDFSTEDRQKLDNYVVSLEETVVTKLNQDEQRAYWTNMYNAVTVKVILDHDPLDSIREIDIASDVLANGPWKAKLVEVEGQELTLDDIEHRILRPIWQDARTHYAINCGAISCPNLHERAFTAANMEETLDKLAIAYINDPRGLQVINGEVHASKIFQWFQVDFGGTEEAVLDHVRIYASDELREKLSGITSITSYGYDWALNRDEGEYSSDWKLDQAPVQFASDTTRDQTTSETVYDWTFNQGPRQYGQTTSTRLTKAEIRAEKKRERRRKAAERRRKRDEKTSKRRLDALLNRDVGAAGGS